MLTLEEYLSREAERRFAYGTCDCATFGLGWARERTGRRLAMPFLYRNHREAFRSVRAYGGLRNIVSAWMASNGFKETSAPEDGDLGLAPVPETLAVVAPVAIVIRCGPWWMTREPKGIGGVQFEKIPAWRIV